MRKLPSICHFIFLRYSLIVCLGVFGGLNSRCCYLSFRSAGVTDIQGCSLTQWHGLPCPLYRFTLFSHQCWGLNLVSARQATFPRADLLPSHIPSCNLQMWFLMSFVFPATGVNNKSAQVLLLLVVPGHLIFLYTIHLMKSGHTSLTVVFVVVYLLAAVLQVRGTNLKSLLRRVLDFSSTQHSDHFRTSPVHSIVTISEVSWGLCIDLI